MLPTRKILTAGATFSAALAIGFVMQNGGAWAARFGADGQHNAAVLPAQDLGLAYNAPSMSAPDTSYQVAELSLPVMDMPNISDITPTLVAAVIPEQDLDVAADPIDAACAPDMSATAQGNGLVDLMVSGACFSNARVTIHHQGMMFAAATDSQGQLNLTVPALSENAMFIASFDQGMGAVATAQVPEVANLERAVLQWQGEAAVGIHAFEGNAAFGETGHVWLEMPDNGDGFLIELGDRSLPDPMLAEVYTYPAGTATTDKQVALSVEAEITITNCGRDVAAQSIQIGPLHDAEAVDLQLRMPDCDAVGDYLVLKNMFEDLKIAAK